jgi:hypothetical protein
LSLPSVNDENSRFCQCKSFYLWNTVNVDPHHYLWNAINVDPHHSCQIIVLRAKERELEVEWHRSPPPADLRQLPTQLRTPQYIRRHSP